MSGFVEIVSGRQGQTVTDKIVDFAESSQMTDSGIFYNFEPELYTIWNFSKATNEVRQN